MKTKSQNTLISLKISPQLLVILAAPIKNIYIYINTTKFKKKKKKSGTVRPCRLAKLDNTYSPDHKRAMIFRPLPGGIITIELSPVNVSSQPEVLTCHPMTTSHSHDYSHVDPCMITYILYIICTILHMKSSPKYRATLPPYFYLDTLVAILICDIYSSQTYA